MGLLPFVDKRQTIENAKKILSSYSGMRRVAGLPVETKVTPTYTFEPKGFTGTVNKQLENSVIRKLNAEQFVAKVESAINKITDSNHRGILINKYIYEYKNDYSIIILEMTDTDFYRELENALLWFSEFYNNGCLIVFEKNFWE